ncbi:MAG: hypothetical protein KDD69_16735 [Bdellovibrionales bacterium]|nr:hypothetical protein [Bdellovibrionales bacterium]
MRGSLSRFLLILTPLLLLVLSATAVADQWSLDGEQEHPPAQDRNRIIKWCSEDGTKTRFASANIKLKGYSPCGTLKANATCDAGGTRIIGKADERPTGHRDCAIGPRILIINHSEEDTIDRTHAADNPEDITAMSSSEEAAMKRELEAAERQQANDPALQLQKFADLLLQQMLTGTPGKQNPRELDKMLQHVDPKTRESLKQLLKQYR